MFNIHDNDTIHMGGQISLLNQVHCLKRVNLKLDLYVNNTINDLKSLTAH